MKKVFFTLLALVLIVTVLAVPAAASGVSGSITIDPQTSDNVHPGQTITFTLTANPNGNDIGSLSGSLEASSGLTINDDSAVKSAESLFTFKTYYSDTHKIEYTNADHGVTVSGGLQFLSIQCKVSETAPQGQQTLKFKVENFKTFTHQDMLSRDTEITATINVVHDSDPNSSDHHYSGYPGSPTTTVEATCTKDGSKEYKCDGCDVRKIEYTSATGHQLTLKDAQSGNADIFTWSDAGDGASTATAWVQCTSPKCDDDGYGGQGRQVTVKVEPNGKGTAPTCTSGGSVGYTGTVTIEDVKHAGGAWTWSQEHTKTFPTGLGHNYDVSKVTWSEFQSSAPTAQMTATLDCTRCGAAGRITATANPTEQVGEKVEATCKAAGYLVYKATVNFTGQNDKAPDQDITGEWHVPIDQLQHQWQEEDNVTVNWTGPDDNKTITDIVKVTCSQPGCDYKSDGYELKWNITSSGTPASCEKDGDLTWTAKATIPALDITPAKTYTKTTTTKPTATGHNIGENVTFNWPTSYTSNDANALKSQVTATATCSNTNCDQKNTLTGTVTGVVKYTDGGDQPEWKEPNYVENGTYVFKATASFDKVADGGSSRAVTRDGYKFYTIDPLEPEVKAPSVDDKADAITENTAADGKLQDNVSDMVAAALASSTQTPGMEEKLYNAIREAGGSTTENDLQIDTKLVVDNADTATVASSITSVLADNVKDAFNIYIEVTVTSNKLGSRTEMGLITEIADPIDFTATLPNGGPIWYVMSDHGGSWNKIKSHVDGGNIVFTTNQFSNFALISSNDLADADIQPDPIPAQKWTGKAIEPQITVTINGGTETLELGKDYTISYENNVNASNSAKIIIKAVPVEEGGRFTGQKEVTFTITKDPVKATAKPSAAPTAPNTGDETPVGLYATVVIVCAAALTALVVVLVRRRRHQR